MHYEGQAETVCMGVCVGMGGCIMKNKLRLLVYMCMWICSHNAVGKALGWRNEQFQIHPNLCIWPWNKAVIIKLIIDAC